MAERSERRVLFCLFVCFSSVSERKREEEREEGGGGIFGGWVLRPGVEGEGEQGRERGGRWRGGGGSVTVPGRMRLTL